MIRRLSPKSSPGRSLAASTVISSLALTAAIAAWTVCGDALKVGDTAFLHELSAGRSARASLRADWGGTGVSLGAAPSSTASMALADQSPLVLTGLSGETLAAAAPSTAIVQLFAAPPVPFTTFAKVAPVLAGEQVAATIEAAGGSGGTGAGPKAGGAPAFNHRPSSAGACLAAQGEGGRKSDDPNAPVADYALVFAQQPAPGSAASLLPASLQASWRAVVETLVLTGEPKPTIVRNL